MIKVGRRAAEMRFLLGRMQTHKRTGFTSTNSSSLLVQINQTSHQDTFHVNFHLK